jgi:hypothetical protein
MSQSHLKKNPKQDGEAPVDVPAGTTAVEMNTVDDDVFSPDVAVQVYVATNFSAIPYDAKSLRDVYALRVLGHFPAFRGQMAQERFSVALQTFKVKSIHELGDVISNMALRLSPSGLCDKLAPKEGFEALTLNNINRLVKLVRG